MNKFSTVTVAQFLVQNFDGQNVDKFDYFYDFPLLVTSSLHVDRFSLHATSKPEPNMLKLLQIIPSSTSQ